MNNRIVFVPVAAVVRTVAIIVAATIIAAAATSGVVAQTPPSPTGTPKAPRSFATPDVTKTAPVKQTRSCSSYGEGFVNVPGTDTCIKAGGYMRTDAGASH
jgi:hypothetical protein